MAEETVELRGMIHIRRRLALYRVEFRQVFTGPNRQTNTVNETRVVAVEAGSDTDNRDIEAAAAFCRRLLDAEAKEGDRTTDPGWALAGTRILAAEYLGPLDYVAAWSSE